jgi:Zn-dependent M28 family amino/carboxypeptidase
MAVGVALATAAATATATGLTATAAVRSDTSALTGAVTAEGVEAHLDALQAIADANGGTRASGTPGYTASVDYVTGLLEGAGYQVTEQEFDYQLFVENSDPVLSGYTATEDFLTMEYSGAGDVTAPLTAVDLTLPPAATPSSTSGCEDADFTGFPAGNIALLQRGTCTFREKVDNAIAAGAVAVVIFNEGQEGRTETLAGTLDPPQVSVPVLGTSFDVGVELSTVTSPVRVAVDVSVRTETTSNVVAQTTTGRTDRVVVAGAHLDSVPEGPGINDNGSGTATILETALQMAELGITPRNQVRFAFWGAEESGLIGSEYYVSQLTKKQQQAIAVYLNLDMVGSRNYGRFIYDGDGSGFGTSGPNGSDIVEGVFEDWFASRGLATEPTAFDGRSDYLAFITAGIPAGGLFTGAEDVKTAEQAALFGGDAGVAFDPCYHQACDDRDNVSAQAIDEMSDATAHAVLTFAMTTSAVNGTGKGKGTPPGAFDFHGNRLAR